MSKSTTDSDIKCPACGAPHLCQTGRGWNQIKTGIWGCDCGAWGTIWYTGDEITELRRESGDMP